MAGLLYYLPVIVTAGVVIGALILGGYFIREYVRVRKNWRELPLYRFCTQQHEQFTYSEGGSADPV